MGCNRASRAVGGMRGAFWLLVSLWMACCFLHPMASAAQSLTVEVREEYGEVWGPVEGNRTLEMAIKRSGFPLGSVRSIAISAGDIQAEDWKWLMESHSKGLLKALTDLVISESVSSVAVLPENLFSKCNTLERVRIAKVETILAQAFMGCLSLRSVDLPDAKIIGSEAFASCVSLINARIPRVERVEAQAFRGDRALVSVALPGVKSIGREAFAHCLSISNLLLPAEWVPTVGEAAFEGCPFQRWLVTVDAQGNFNRKALSRYVNDPSDGRAGDALWFRWALAEDIHRVLLASEPTKGTVAIPSYAAGGSVVKFFIMPYPGYELGQLDYRELGGAFEEMEGLESLENEGNFTMPEADVEVSIVFVANRLRIAVNGVVIPGVYTSLEAALRHYTEMGKRLSQVEHLEIKEGKLQRADWLWLKSHQHELSSLRE